MHPALLNDSSANYKEAGALTFVAKQLPLIGTGVSLFSAGNRLLKKDYLGAGLDTVSAALSPFNPMLSVGVDAVGLVRDALNSDEVKENQKKYETMDMIQHKQANFAEDLQDPQAGLNSDLYKAISPVISSQGDAGLTGHDAARTKHLQEQVRKGLVGLEYLSGIKKNKGNTFYDEHPVEAVTTELASHPLTLGGATLGGAALINYRRQKSNMDKTEPAQMARSGNPLDTTNPTNLLDPAGETKGSTRGDISRVFGDLENDPEHRLRLIDRLNKAEGDNSFVGRLKQLEETKAKAIAEHTAKSEELKNYLGTGKHMSRDEVERLKAMSSAQLGKHEQELSKLNDLKKKLIQEARQSEGSTGLKKYVNLHESLRRAREKGGLKGMLGEGAGALGGVKDLLEKYHITGAHPHYDQELIRNILHEYGGSHMPEPKMRATINKILETIGDEAHQASGLRKGLSRLKMPLAYGAAATVGSAGLYHLLKMMQNQSHSSEKQKEWKKNILKARGDFEGAQNIQ
jgi:hypothetical protein